MSFQNGFIQMATLENANFYANYNNCLYEQIIIFECSGSKYPHAEILRGSFD